MLIKQNDTKASILIVDDTLANLRVLAAMLYDQGYNIQPVTSGNLALKIANTHPPDLILLDINMPDMDGYEICQQLKSNHELKDIPVIFISALNDTFDKVKAFSVGGIDYITKPFQLEEVYARVETHIKLRRLSIEQEIRKKELELMVNDQVKEISQSQIATIIAMAKLAESRDDVTGRHLDRIQYYSKTLAAQLAKRVKYKDQIDNAYLENIYLASSLHDIGKVGITDNILLKPGKLTPEEFQVMKNHTLIGTSALESVKARYPKNDMVNMGILITRSHHEDWNGDGYPDRLCGDEIPLCARIVRVADVYDALRSKRIYKPVFSHDASIKIIMQDIGIRYDPEIAEAFNDVHDEFDHIYKWHE